MAEERMFPYNIVLIGFMGTGKSTIAKHLSRRYGMEIVEMDREIEEREGMRIPEIFEQKGEKYFRERETNLLKEIQNYSNKIISCGGGAVLREENVKEMKRNGKVVLLTASPECVLERTKKSQNRPLLQKNHSLEAIQNMMEERREKYERAADLIVDTDGKEISLICQEIADRLP